MEIVLCKVCDREVEVRRDGRRRDVGTDGRARCSDCGAYVADSEASRAERLVEYMRARDGQPVRPSMPDRPLVWSEWLAGFNAGRADAARRRASAAQGVIL